MPTAAASDDLSAKARSLARVIEPVVGQVFFSPECHERYAALGFSPSPGTTAAGVQLPDGPAYFTSRGSCLGQAPGELVAAAFGVFNVDVVVPAVTFGWTLTDAATIADARLRGAVDQLTRVLGPSPQGVDRAVELLARAVEPLEPWGRALFAGTLSQPLTGEPLGDLFRWGDRLREFRGDCHIAAWVAAGLDACEVGLLTELYWGMPARSYVRTRAWGSDQLDAAADRLTAAGHLADGALTDSGRAFREQVERATDALMAPAITALGDDLEELVGLLTPWDEAVMAAGGYPPSPLAISPPG
ncbi:MAG: SCO6745 family protein [Acidimicrobiales bacterium]